MKPNNTFKNLEKSFWANVRSISQKNGYTTRADKKKKIASAIKVPTIDEIKNSLTAIGLSYNHLVNSDNSATELGALLIEYFTYRADVLNNNVETLLMDVNESKTLYTNLLKKIKPTCIQPMNKQKDEKKAPAFFTCMINMIIENCLKGLPCNYDPRELTTITKNGFPLRTLSRWVDGAFPSPVNPIAIWEIKEYYYTTTFGSRVADGVYETLLDGMELEEIYEHENIDVKHYLFIDSHNTWWNDGKAYLCRIIDMMHMGYVDEVFFGKEILERLPIVVDEWKTLYK